MFGLHFTTKQTYPRYWSQYFGLKKVISRKKTTYIDLMVSTIKVTT